MEVPTLSVIMITYGHENYIQQAIEGVFMQKTNFPIELIICNDASPDATDIIINDILKKAPSHIYVRYIKHENNIGMMKNHHFALKKAVGKYIAICDGDDFWTDKKKIQKQVAFLENNPDFSIVCHNFKTQNGDIISEHSHFDNLNLKENADIVDLAENNIIATLTAVIRNVEINIKKWTEDAPLGDLILFLQVARSGKIKYLNEKMAVYRENVGVWSGKKMKHENMVYLYDNLADDYKDLPKVRANLLLNKNKHAKAYLKELSFSQMIYNKYFKEISTKEKSKLVLQRLF